MTSRKETATLAQELRAIEERRDGLLADLEKAEAALAPVEAMKADVARLDALAYLGELSPDEASHARVDVEQKAGALTGALDGLRGLREAVDARVEEKRAEVAAAKMADAQAKLDSALDESRKAAATFAAKARDAAGAARDLERRRERVQTARAAVEELHGGGNVPWPREADEADWGDLDTLRAVLARGPIRPVADAQAAQASAEAAAHDRDQEALAQLELHARKGGDDGLLRQVVQDYPHLAEEARELHERLVGEHRALALAQEEARRRRYGFPDARHAAGWAPRRGAPGRLVTGRRLLPRPWALGDVEDVEAFCATLLDRGLARFSMHLRPQDEEELVADLLAAAWAAWERYDPAREVPWAGWLAWRLNLEVVEGLRRRFGRNGHRLRAEAATASLDEQLALGEGELGSAVTAGAGDGGPDRPPDLRRLLARGDRPDDRAAVAEVVEAARTGKGVGRLIAELRAELTAQAEQAA